MDVNRLNTGEKLAGVSGVVLLLVMFIFDWFSIDVVGGGSVGLNAWESFSYIDIILFLAAVSGIALAAVKAMDGTSGDLPLSTITAGVGGLAALLVLFRIISPPGFDIPDNSGIDVGREIGVFLGFLASLGVAAGGYKAMQEEGTTFGDTADRFSGGGGAADRGTAPGTGPAERPTAPPAPPAPPPPPSEHRP
jgi:hypothetical protein